MTKRREFLASLSSALLSSGAFFSTSSIATGNTPAGRERFAGDYGLELYSLRTQIARDMPRTLAMVKRIGYTEVEAVHGFWGSASVRNMPGILRAAAEADVQRYYVEDESAEAPRDIRVDYRYLRTIRF